MARTINDLRQMQALPLDLKIRLTESRIRQWVNEYGEDGVYISFSGGKDSTVLLHIVRSLYPDIPAVFVNTGLEYPEIVAFVKTFENVEIIKPAMNFKKVISAYGYPFISKEAAESVYNAKKYIESNGKTYQEFYRKLLGIGEFAEGGKRCNYSMKRFTFFLKEDAPKISHMCCKVMKKKPIHEYARTTQKVAITAEMAEESRRRTSNWLLHGCNMFDLQQNKKSTPLAFWTEQDVLQYIKKYNVRIASVYGEVVQDEEKSELPEGQLCFLSDEHILTGKTGELLETPCKYKTTGCDRTGCMFCGFGCHLEKPGEGRFERMKVTHPKLYDWIMKPTEEGGLNYKAVIDWLNENGNLNIKY